MNDYWAKQVRQICDKRAEGNINMMNKSRNMALYFTTKSQLSCPQLSCVNPPPLWVPELQLSQKSSVMKQITML